MEIIATETKERLLNRNKLLVSFNISNFTKDKLKQILENKRQMYNANEFEMFKMAKEWCEREKQNILEFIDYFNFSFFNSQQLSYALEVGVSPKILYNALNKSKILGYDDLNFFTGCK